MEWRERQHVRLEVVLVESKQAGVRVAFVFPSKFVEMTIDKSSKAMDNESIIERAASSYESHSQRFAYQTKDFSKQFSHIYGARLGKMRDILLKSIEKKWGKKYRILKLQEIKEDDGVQCVIIGTLFKHQELKPSVLKEISEEQQLVPQPPRTFFVDDADTLILEDDLQRIRLTGALDVHSVVTGIVCAVLGREEGGDRFCVEDVCWPGAQNAVDRPIAPTDEGRRLVLVSGLDTASAGSSLMAMELLLSWLSGFVDCDSQSICRLVIAGNALRSRPADSAETEDGTQRLDNLLHAIGSSVDVDLMPGEFDPANHMLPQQPLHHCLLPKASALSSVRGCPNPHDFVEAGCRVLGSSGQPVQAVLHASRLHTPMDALEATLRWGHLAPSCPDTLPCYPYYKDDPFVINNAPDVYFAGNQASFETRMFVDDGGHRVRLISVPSFCDTCSCVVVDLSTLDCYEISFKADDARP